MTAPPSENTSEATGYSLYCEGRYSEAFNILKADVERGDFCCITALADICYRNLDGNRRPLSDAAYLYLKGAQARDGEALSYLASLSDTIIDDITDKTIATKVQDLVRIWKTAEQSN